VNNSALIRDSLAEFIGTFMLILVGAGAVTLMGRSSNPVAADVIVAALAHGLILIAIISTYGSISGAHVNPAVTLGLLIGGQVNIVRAIAYWIAQFAGGIAAGFLLRYIFPGVATLGNTLPANGISDVQIMLIEGLLTFFLVSTVYQVAAFGRSATPVAVAIGFTLAASILFGGPLTGASLNPARTLGPAVATGNYEHILFYMIGIFGGGAIAGVVHSLIFPKPGKN
jgi:MIP family channel proteins